MLSVKTGLASLAAGGVLAATAVLLSAPAYADTPSNPGVPTTCFQAQTFLTQAQHQLAVDQSEDASSDGPLQGAADFTPDQNDLDVTTARGYMNTEQGYVNALCGGSTSTGGGVGLPRPHPGPVGLPVLTCAQIPANTPQGSPYYRTYLDPDHDGIACETTTPPVTTVPSGAYQVIDGVKCKHVGTTWVPVQPYAPTVTYQVIDGVNCHYNGTSWVPVTPPPVTVTRPCDCTPTPEPTPAPVAIVQQPPQVVYTPAPAPVIVPPAQVFTNQVAPSIGAVATGDGSVFGGQH